MSENYFYSSLSGQEIEDTLVGAVRFNAMQGLTTSQKALARQNIGAGEANTQIKIKGFYATIEDLQQQIPVGTEGDVYAIGTESPYDLYIWDAVNNVWVNNGPISFSDAIIDDNDISTTSVWSSAKTTNEIAEVSSDVDAVEGSLATYVRPNLLDNAYFIGGGSQGNHGKFPINQRGQTSYNGAGYTIDRWHNASNAGAVTLSSDGILLVSSNGNWANLNQYPANPTGLFGKLVTLSALGSNGELVEATGTIPTSFPSQEETVLSAGALTDGPLIMIRMDATKIHFRISTNVTNLTTKVVAMKLELGSGQTLVHQENGSWVLNEIPSYWQELEKCQHYLYPVIANNLTNGPLAGGYGFSSTSIRVSFQVPPMAINDPSIVFLSGSVSSLRLISDSGTLTPTAVSVASFKRGSAVLLLFTVSGATTNKTYWLNSNGADFLLSAEP